MANGGIETDPTSGRAELNLATMRSNLAYVDVGTGALLDVLVLPQALRLLSIRHIAAGRDGTLAAALQWQGSELEDPPLLAVHRPGAAGLETLAAEPAVQRRTRNYAGSVAVSDDGRRAAITAPRGNLMLVFDLAARARWRWSRRPTSAAWRRRGGRLRLLDRRGAVPEPRRRGGERRRGAAAGLAFDNHLVRNLRVRRSLRTSLREARTAPRCRLRRRRASGGSIFAKKKAGRQRAARAAGGVHACPDGHVFDIER